MFSLNQQHQNKKFLYLGRSFDLSISNNSQKPIHLTDKFYIAPPLLPKINLYLKSWYKQQARTIIQKRVELYATKAKLSYNTISISDAQTNWGSCSSQKNLRFNWRLIMAPTEVIDYVISHELAHLEHLNHSPAFWEKVRKIFPIYRQYRTWLKHHGSTLKI